MHIVINTKHTYHSLDESRGLFNKFVVYCLVDVCATPRIAVLPHIENRTPDTCRHSLADVCITKHNHGRLAP